MSHIEPWQLNFESYPFSVQIETRFQDVDILGHINNVAMASLFESGRVRFSSKYDNVWMEADRRALIAAITINYVAESYYPQPMLLCCGIAKIGNTSWQVAQAAFQYRREEHAAGELPVCVAAGAATLVLTDGNGSLTLPDSLIDALQARRVKNQ